MEDNKKKLEEDVVAYFGTRYLNQLELPHYFSTALCPSFKLRPYQEECFRYFQALLSTEPEWLKALGTRRHFLFQMATGSGKTLMMAGMLLMLYERGYRNVLFFVDKTAIITKTRLNFITPTASKYLFNSPIKMGDKTIEIREVPNFQNSDPNCLNICFTTLAQLHLDMTKPRENAPTYEDFEGLKLVMIADEAHHINATTRRGGSKGARDLWGNMGGYESEGWEDTVERIHDLSDSILLEFTATMPFSNPFIRAKYLDKLLYDYPLRKFREDKYSKEIEVVQRDLGVMDRALQAVVLSQYKRKLFNSIRQNIKPVIFFKSKYKKDNKAFFDQFVATIQQLKAAHLEEIRKGAVGDVATAFDYFDREGRSFAQLADEIREEFREDKLIIYDGNNQSEEDQVLVNTLEDRENEIRAIFAVDMLGEGWDVLNLFDIVRLYDTRDANKGVAGKTTVSEAQLIGRGARYMPFDAPEEDLPRGQRKYDNDLAHPLRMVEKLHYHSAHNPQYIQELKTVLVESGLLAKVSTDVELKIKEKFKESPLYTVGKVFVNKRVPKEREVTMQDLWDSHLPTKILDVTLYTGEMQQQAVFGEERAMNSSKQREVSTFQITFADLGSSVVRSALYHFNEYSFQHLRNQLRGLESTKEFIESDKYLAPLPIRVSCDKPSFGNLSQRERYEIAIAALRELAPAIGVEEVPYEGSRLFEPRDFKEVFKDHIIKLDSDVAMGDGPIIMERDMKDLEWHVYDKCLGTSEEQALIKYIDGIYDKLSTKYDQIYLVRNERDLKIYAFEDGAAFEPDYLLFMKKRKEKEVVAYYQIFIEPKGSHLSLKDQWKETFMLEVETKAEVEFTQKGKEYILLGLPFYGDYKSVEFDEDLRKKLDL